MKKLFALLCLSLCVQAQIQPKETLHFGLNDVDIVCRHADGTVFKHINGHNLVTNGGIDLVASAIGNFGSQSPALNFIAVTNDSAAPAVTDTVLTSEIAGTGLQRAQATYSHAAGQNPASRSFTFTKTFTATGTVTFQKAGLFNASVNGVLGAEFQFGSTTLNLNDTATFTWSWTF